MYKIGIVASPLCTLCNLEPETITHLLWECPEVQKLLDSFDILLEALVIPFAINKTSFLLGLKHESFLPSNRVDNEIIIILKQYIYKTRCLGNTLSLNALINIIKDNYVVQKFIAYSKGNHAKNCFEEEWKKWESIIKL